MWAMQNHWRDTWHGFGRRSHGINDQRGAHTQSATLITMTRDLTNQRGVSCTVPSAEQAGRLNGKALGIEVWNTFGTLDVRVFGQCEHERRRAAKFFDCLVQRWVIWRDVSRRSVPKWPVHAAVRPRIPSWVHLASTKGTMKHNTRSRGSA